MWNLTFIDMLSSGDFQVYLRSIFLSSSSTFLEIPLLSKDTRIQNASSQALV